MFSSVTSALGDGSRGASPSVAVVVVAAVAAAVGSGSSITVFPLLLFQDFNILKITVLVN